VSIGGNGGIKSHKNEEPKHANNNVSNISIPSYGCCSFEIPSASAVASRPYNQRLYCPLSYKKMMAKNITPIIMAESIPLTLVALGPENGSFCKASEIPIASITKSITAMTTIPP